MKFSIITPSFNQAQFLPYAQQSILTQDVDLEWIILDAQSTDETRSILSRINDPRVKWKSEPDRGQSDALNKGFAMASGDIVAWLNCDDLYTRQALKSVHDAFAEQPSRNWLTGRCDVIDPTGITIRESVTRYKNRRLDSYSYRKLLLENFISQPATFWRRAFLDRVGKLDESLHWTMDYDLWLRMGKIENPIILQNTLAQFRMYPASKSGSSNRQRFEEDFNVAMRYIGTDRWMKLRKRMAIEKIVLAYNVLKLFRG